MTVLYPKPAYQVGENVMLVLNNKLLGPFEILERQAVEDTWAYLMDDGYETPHWHYEVHLVPANEDNKNDMEADNE